MAVKSKSFVILRLGIKYYPPIFTYAESFYAIKCKHSFFKYVFKAIKFKCLEIERLGIKDYPSPIFLHAESIYIS